MPGPIQTPWGRTRIAVVDSAPVDDAVAACPDENTVAMFVRGELDAGEVAAIEFHIDRCAGCAEVVVEVARLFGEPASLATAGATLVSAATARGATDWLAPGERVGRYRVLEAIGAGGMGVVYAAYDPELDRRVALKLLHAGGDTGSEGRARLQREAQSLAQLSHPNVVAIHDVGAVGQRLFLAMEFVDGQTLRRWLAETSREWSQIRDVFIAAGRGLAAAHVAGLVHRDFKPDNVLIDRDGRVRVTDFGLARRRDGQADPTPEPDVHRDHRRGATEPLTQAGAIVGTPAYMAPEQFDGATLDAASDQYSFCVALYEALWRIRPHPAKSLHELMVAVQTTDPRDPPRDARVPAAVRDAIMRGLSRDRARRFADMSALLAILQRDPWRARRQAALVVIPAVLVAAGATAWASREDTRPEFCRTDPLAGVWDHGERAEAQRWFSDAALPYAEQTAASFERGVDAYALRFEALRERACTPRSATDAAPGVEALRMVCLEERRALLAATLEVLATSVTREHARTILAKAPMIVESLPSLDACDDVARVAALQGEPVPPTLAAAVIDNRARLAEAASLVLGGDYTGALERVDGALDEIEALQFDPLRAQLRLGRGRVLNQLGRFADSRADFEQSAELALRAGDRVTAADALIELVWVFGQSGSQVELAEFAARQARAAVEGVGAPPRLMSRLHKNLATVKQQAGHGDEAIAELEAAVALASADDTPLFRIELLLDLAKLEATGLRFEAAAAHLQEAGALVATGLGAEHPAMADVAFAQGLIHLSQLEWADSRAAFERALAIRRAALGEHHPDYASDLSVVGQMLVMQGEPEQGVANLREAVAIYERAVGSDHVMTLNVGMRLAHALLAAGHADEAAAHASAVLARSERVLAPSHPAIAAGLGVLADAQTTLGQYDAAIETRSKEITAVIAAHGETHPYVAVAHGAFGETLRRGGRLREAVEPLRRAVEIATDDGPAGSDRAWFVYLLARTRHELGETDPALGSSVRAAIARLVAADDPTRADEVRSWLASLPG